MSAAKSAVKSTAQPTNQPARHWYFRDAPELPEKWRSPLAQDKLLYEYLVHYGHIADFAISRGLTIDQFYDWLHSEPVVERRRRLAEMADERADTVAKLNRPAALERLAEIASNVQDIHPRERRLAANAILRHAQAADRREAQKAKAQALQSPSQPPPSHPLTPSPSQSQSPHHPITSSPSHAPSPSHPPLARIGPNSPSIPRRTPRPRSSASAQEAPCSRFSPPSSSPNPPPNPRRSTSV